MAESGYIIEKKAARGAVSTLEVRCLGHSGFTAAAGNSFLVFDYFTGPLPEIPVREEGEAGRTFVFVSHSHPDHFNPEIFRLRERDPSVTFILSSDIYRDIPEKHGVHDAVFVGPDETIEPDPKVRIRTLRSTDAGVAFLVKAGGRNIYHAGDLNLWLWDGMTEPEAYAMTAAFRDAVGKLRPYSIDLAFIPLDTRQGIYSFLGLDYCMRTLKIRNAVPMHFFGTSKIVRTLMNDPVSSPYRDRISLMEAGNTRTFE